MNKNTAPRRRAGPTGFTITVQRLADRLERDHGRPPSDSELAILLAVSPARIARHRALLARARA